MIRLVIGKEGVKYSKVRIEMDEYLKEFTDEMKRVMEEAMKKDPPRSPTPWDYDIDFLRFRLCKEYQEWDRLSIDKDKVLESQELIDIANFCYFLWVRLSKEKKEQR